MARLTPPVNAADHRKGDANAAVTLLEYGDFQCPHCGAAYPVLQKVEKEFGDSMAFIFRHFPLSESHPFARAAAIASEAAARQSRFWQMHDLIFENQYRLNPQTLLVLAESLKLNMNTFQKDIQDPKLAERVESDFESGIESGVNGTPSFYINAMKYDGSYDFLSISNAVGKEFSGPPKKHPGK